MRKAINVPSELVMYWLNLFGDLASKNWQAVRGVADKSATWGAALREREVISWLIEHNYREAAEELQTYLKTRTTSDIKNKALSFIDSKDGGGDYYDPNWWLLRRIIQACPDDVEL